jgi:alanine racemase
MTPDRAWAEIDLSAIEANVRALRAARPGLALIAVLKADAYGHGAVPVARAVLAAGAARLGVGDSREALELRRAGIDAPILILGSVLDPELPAVISNGVSTSVHSLKRVELLAEEARRRGRRARVQLKIDTGMGRLGVLPEAAPRLAEAIVRSRLLDFEGCYTHFAEAGPSGTRTTIEQVSRFSAALAAVTAVIGRRPPEIHLRNSAWVLADGIGDGESTAIRPGAFLYGFLPAKEVEAPALLPAMSLKTQVLFMKDVPPGTAVGYGGTFACRRKTRVAILPVGYNDGYPQTLGNRAEVLLRGRRAPVVGSVCMDYTAVDVTDVPGAAVGDEVLLIGAQGRESVRLEEVAERAGLIPYAIVCAVGKRVKRTYVKGTMSTQEPGRAYPMGERA